MKIEVRLTYLSVSLPGKQRYGSQRPAPSRLPRTGDVPDQLVDGSEHDASSRRRRRDVVAVDEPGLAQPRADRRSTGRGSGWERARRPACRHRAGRRRGGAIRSARRASCLCRRAAVERRPRAGSFDSAFRSPGRARRTCCRSITSFDALSATVRGRSFSAAGTVVTRRPLEDSTMTSPEPKLCPGPITPLLPDRYPEPSIDQGSFPRACDQRGPNPDSLSAARVQRRARPRVQRLVHSSTRW